MWNRRDVKMGLKKKLISSGLLKTRDGKVLSDEGKMKYLAFYAIPDISEAEEDLEICLHDLTQDEA